MTLTEKLEEYMRKMQKDGIDLSTVSSADILTGYYVNLGVSSQTSFLLWMHKIKEGEYPAYGSVTRAIRAARVNNPEWRKKNKQQQVEKVKKEVGY